MRLACAALLLLAAPLAAQDDEVDRARRLVFDASRALQAGNPARFLSYFDKQATPHFEQLRDNVVALIASKDIASSVEIVESRVEDDVVRFSVDWLLQLTPVRELGQVEQRRERVEVEVRLKGKPKIVSLDPASYFAPTMPSNPATKALA